MLLPLLFLPLFILFPAVSTFFPISAMTFDDIDELLLVHNKNDPKEGLGVVSKADEKGNYQTHEQDQSSYLQG